MHAGENDLSTNIAHFQLFSAMSGSSTDSDDDSPSKVSLKRARHCVVEIETSGTMKLNARYMRRSMDTATGASVSLPRSCVLRGPDQ